jgi:hypothetical protein
MGPASGRASIVSDYLQILRLNLILLTVLFLLLTFSQAVDANGGIYALVPLAIAVWLVVVLAGRRAKPEHAPVDHTAPEQTELNPGKSNPDACALHLLLMHQHERWLARTYVFIHNRASERRLDSE